MNSDESNQRSITEENIPKEIIEKHKGKATFHPSGKYLLIGCENENGKKLMWSQRYAKAKGALLRKKNEFGF